MGQERVRLEVHGEYEKELLVGVWVTFPGSRRIPSLWRDIEAMIQSLKDYLVNCPGFVPEDLVSLTAGERVTCDGAFDAEVLNTLGSGLDWQL